MALNYSDDGNSNAEPIDGGHRQTIAGLFEDTIDARNALNRIRRANIQPEAVSVIFRDRKADQGGPADRHGAVARAVARADLNGVSKWLVGLASLIVPERGTYVVAGPMGAMLASISFSRDEEQDAEERPSALLSVLQEFGFEGDEATYIEHRLTAGAVMVAKTSDDEALADSAKQIFGTNDAVYIGESITVGHVADQANELLLSPPEVYRESDVVVTDAVARLRPLRASGGDQVWLDQFIGISVLDRDGAEAGLVVDLITEVAPDGSLNVEPEQVRYVVVGYGGMLGIGRRQVAVPVEQLSLDQQPARSLVTRDVLHGAPNYDPDAPFSRREEHAVCAYFGMTPYWAVDQ